MAKSKSGPQRKELTFETPSAPEREYLHDLPRFIDLIALSPNGKLLAMAFEGDTAMLYNVVFGGKKGQFRGILGL